MNIEAWGSQQAIGMDLQGLLDSGPCLFSRHSDSHVGFENSLNVTDHGWQCRGIDTAQLCPAETSSPTCSFSDDDSPCPSDRWCEDSAFELSTVDFRTCYKPRLYRGLTSKSVSFETTVDVFGFDPASPADAFPEEWWVDEVEPLVPASHHASHKDQVSNVVTLDPYSEFWDDWCSFWKPVQQIIDSNGPSLPRGGNLGRFDEYDNDSFAGGGSWKEHRNEGGLAAAIQDPRLTDPRAYAPEVPADDESDDDLGVTFYRWVDVIQVMDLHPYRLGGSIPFITYGLRRHHLGRRDFSSPDLLPGRIKELVWNLWQDEVGRFEQVVIHFIRPQPVRELGADGVLILLIEILCDENPPGSSPALAVTCDTSHRLMDSPKALYVDRAVDVPSLMPHFGLSYLCAPRGFRQCTFTVASALIGAYLTPVPAGALIKLVISAKLRIFAHAFEWFPDLERFASVVREQVRRGLQDHELVVHCSDAPSKSFGFRIGQLSVLGRLLNGVIALKCNVARRNVMLSC